MSERPTAAQNRPASTAQPVAARPGRPRIRLAALSEPSIGSPAVASPSGDMPSPEPAAVTTEPPSTRPSAIAESAAPLTPETPSAGTAAGSGLSSAAVAATIGDCAATLLGSEPDQSFLDTSFTDLGLDSIFRMDLARSLISVYGVELKAGDLYEQDSAILLANHILALLAETGSQPQPSSAAPAQPASSAEAASLLGQLLQALVGREFDPGRSFAENSVNSFDMLRSISALEHEFGSLKKTLLFDFPTVTELTEHLREVHGQAAVEAGVRAAVARAEAAGDIGDQQVGVKIGAITPTEDGQWWRRDAVDGPLVVHKRSLGGMPAVAELMQSIDGEHAKEGGLAGRDIAPLAFLGSGRTSYFNFSRRGGDLFAWSYVGSESDFPVLIAEFLQYAAAHGLNPNFLSLAPVLEAAGVALTATPFGAVQRLEDLQNFTLTGGKMSRLRYMLGKFEKAGVCRTEEYQVGSDQALDAEVVELIGRWADGKQMVNPYVPIFRAELARGTLSSRHRMFLTTIDGRLSNAVIITKISSENGYLLDLEFYPAGMPLGGLEFAVVNILKQLVDEGCTIFSFGASFGVQISESQNSSSEVERGLAELRDAGIFGAGNFQFKNKFRPVNIPIFLCQPAAEPHTSVADVILMIANPDVSAGAPGLAEPDRPDVGPRVTSTATGSSAPQGPAVPAYRPTPEAPRRRALLAVHGWNPLALAYADVPLDLVTDSWAEHASAIVDAAVSDLRARARSGTGAVDVPTPNWLPFDSVTVAGSGRAAEAMLCRTWPGKRGAVVHNTLFPTWHLNLAENGFRPEPVATLAGPGITAAETFAGNVDVTALRRRLSDGTRPVSFVCLELSNNASGGVPISLANLKLVREATADLGVALVLDATRVLDNAVFIGRHEHGQVGREVWSIVTELLAQADAVTISLSKQFGVDFGGLLATSAAELTEHVAGHAAAHGHELGLTARRMVGVTLADTDRNLAAAVERLDAVGEIWQQLAQAGLPVSATAGGHCVLLDIGRLSPFAELHSPVPSFLAWLYERTGLRAGPHLVPEQPGKPNTLVRLAFPAGTSREQARDVGAALRAALADLAPITDLLPVGSAVATTAAARGQFHPAEQLPEDIGAALREGQRAHGDNHALLVENAPATQRFLIPAGNGKLEVFTAGVGPTLLLMHPFNIGAGVFSRQFADLATQFRLVVVHNPGVGDSTEAADLSLPGLAELNRSALRELGFTDPVHVGGASFGGLIAQTFALRYPEGVRSLSLIGSSYKVGNRMGEVNRLGTVSDEDFDAIVANDPSGALAAERAECQRLLSRAESMDPKIGLSYLDVFAAAPTLLSALPSISTPTLVLHGRLDTVVPLKAAHLLHGAIPDAHLVELPGAGHFPFVTHVAEVHRELVPFLHRHSALAATGAGR